MKVFREDNSIDYYLKEIIIIIIMGCIINYWTGRFGNNILQIIRCIHYCFTYKHNIIYIPEHINLNNTTILIEEIKGNNEEMIKDTFFNFKDNLEPKLMKYYYQKYIKDIIKFNFDNIEINKNDLFIHIRSGDIFEKNPHSYYVQPPLIYYKNIIQNYQKTNIIYEDDKNPCVNELKKINNVNMLNIDIEQTLREFLKATHLAIGFGTFGLLLYIMNTNLKKIYMPRYVYEELPQGDWGIDLELIDLPNYIKCGEWKSTPEQLDLMINYNL